MPPPILLYDGVCGLCNRSVQFILRRDCSALFRFAALQSDFAARILTRHGADPAVLDTFYVVLNQGTPSESLLARSDAVLYILEQLGGIWKAAAVLGRLIPRPIRNWAYGIVVRNRYRVFGRYDTCPLPSPDTRSRFLDQ